MANTCNVVIYWGGEVIRNASGTSYNGGTRRMFRVREGTSLNDLKDKIATKMNLTPDQAIIGLTYRFPTITNGEMSFTDAEINEDDELEMVYEVRRAFPQYNLIELYVEVGFEESFQIIDDNPEPPVQSQQYPDSTDFVEHGTSLSTDVIPTSQSWWQDTQQHPEHFYSGWMDSTSMQNEGRSNIGAGHEDEAGPSTMGGWTPMRHSVDLGASTSQQTSFPRYSVDLGASSSQQIPFPRYSVDVGASGDWRQSSPVRIEPSHEPYRHSVHFPCIEEAPTAESPQREEYTGGWSSESADDPDYVPTEGEDNDGSDVPEIDFDLNQAPQHSPSSSSVQHPLRMDLLLPTNLNRMVVDEEDSSAMAQASDQVQIKKGLKFDSKDQLIAAVKRSSILQHKSFHVTHSDKKRWTAECNRGGCPWRIRGAKKMLSQKWEISTYDGTHTCLAASISSRHPNLDSRLLAMEVEEMVAEDAGVKIKVLVAAVRIKFQYSPTYRRTWIAKDRAIQKLYGQWDESYNKLPHFFSALCATNPGTVVQWQHFDHSPDGNSVVYTGEDTFLRVFWAFQPCIMAWKLSRPVLLVDATFLYGKYRGTLLIASGVDGGDQIIPVAFAIVESESGMTWNWFLSNIKAHVTRTRRLCVISDRHPGLMSVMGGHRVWSAGEAVHRICARHLGANAAKNFKKPSLAGTVKGIGQKKNIFYAKHGLC